MCWARLGSAWVGLDWVGQALGKGTRGRERYVMVGYGLKATGLDRVGGK